MAEQNTQTEDKRFRELPTSRNAPALPISSCLNLNQEISKEKKRIKKTDNSKTTVDINTTFNVCVRACVCAHVCVCVCVCVCDEEEHVFCAKDMCVCVK